MYISPINIKNKYRDLGDVVQIIIVQRNGDVFTTSVTSESFYRHVAPLNVSWCVVHHRYSSYVFSKDYTNRPVGTSGGGKTVYLHRIAAGLADDDTRQVDHISGDGLDNRDENLQVVTQAQNLQRRRLYSQPKANNVATGLRNIRPSGKGFMVRVCHRYVGTFPDRTSALRAAGSARGAENLRRSGMRFEQQAN